MDKPWKVISAFVGVFVAGAIFGGFFTLRATHKQPAFVEQAAVPPKASPAVTVENKAPLPTSGETTKAQAVTAVQVPPTRPPDRILPAVMNQMTRRLNPTVEQRKKILPVVARATDDIQRLTREHWQDTTRVTDRMYEDIAAILTPEQQVQLEKMRQEALERVRKAREKQRDEAQAKSVARPAAGNQPGQPAPNRKSAVPEGANPGR